MVEGIYTCAPSPAEGSRRPTSSVKALAALANPDPYTCQVYDHTNLVLLAMANGKEATGTAIKDNIRKIAQGGGKTVDNAVDGLKAIAEGKEINYAGASGPCDFDDKRRHPRLPFRYEQVKDGKLDACEDRS